MPDMKDAGATEPTTAGDATGASANAQDGNTTSSGDGQASALRQELQETQSALKEQRAVQSGLDKQLNELKQTNDALSSEKERLESEVERLQEMTMTDDVKAEYEKQLQELRASAADTKSSLSSELESTASQMESLQVENERLRILVGEFPNLSALVEADALPQAETADEFREKLGKLSGTFVSKQAAEDYAQREGARPPASPPAGESSDLDTLWNQIKAADEAGNNAKAEELRQQWYDQADRDLK